MLRRASLWSRLWSSAGRPPFSVGLLPRPWSPAAASSILCGLAARSLVLGSCCRVPRSSQGTDHPSLVMQGRQHWLLYLADCEAGTLPDLASLRLLEYSSSAMPHLSAEVSDLTLHPQGGGSTSDTSVVTDQSGGFSLVSLWFGLLTIQSIPSD